MICWLESLPVQISFRIPKKGGKVDGAILDDYALKNGA
jgi:hypothetical protein